MSTLKTIAIQHLNGTNPNIYLDSSGNTGIGISTPTAPLHVAGANTVGGVGYCDFLRVTNQSGGATNINKTFRMNSSGGIEIINSAYNTIPFSLSDTGQLSVGARGISTASVPSGSIIQVAWNAMSGTYSGSGASTRDTGLGASFTPLYSSSKVLHIVTTGAVFVCDGQLYIARNGSIVSPSLQDSYRDGITSSYTVDLPVYAITWVDSPATTSTITYRLHAAATGCGQSIFVGNTDGTGSWLMMEIAQ